jgi:hypothetical protein
VRPVLNRDCAVRTSLMAVAESLSELSALRNSLRETREIMNEAHACMVTSFAAKAKADRLLEQANRLFSTK